LKKFNLSKKTIKKLKGNKIYVKIKLIFNFFILARNIEYLFPVQTESYTSINEQNDCLIQASNGSGKTLAFVIPIVELLQNDKSTELTSGRAPRVLVLAPTRDISNKNFNTIK
jgi:superfamily II DNA/RNA helicase